MITQKRVPVEKNLSKQTKAQLNINHVVVFNRLLSIRAFWSIRIRTHTLSGARSPHLHIIFTEEQIGYNASQANHERPRECIAKAIDGETNN